MTKAELESKHLAELHSLAAEAGVPRYRMLLRAELIERLLEGQPKAAAGPQSRPEPRREPARRRPRGGEERPRGRRERPEPRERPKQPEPVEPAAEPQAPPSSGEAAAGPTRPRRKRRRWRRRGRKGVRVPDLLLPAAPGRQVIVYAETRAGCTSLLCEVASELSATSNGPDPVALLVDPTPEELADWRREAPRAEIVAAGRAQHADDALAQAARRAGAGEDVIVLVDSLSRFTEAYGDAEAAKGIFDAGRELDRSGNGSLTVVVAVERSA